MLQVKEIMPDNDSISGIRVCRCIICHEQARTDVQELLFDIFDWFLQTLSSKLPPICCGNHAPWDATEMHGLHNFSFTGRHRVKPFLISNDTYLFPFPFSQKDKWTLSCMPYSYTCKFDTWLTRKQIHFRQYINLHKHVCHCSECLFYRLIKFIFVQHL